MAKNELGQIYLEDTDEELNGAKEENNIRYVPQSELGKGGKCVVTSQLDLYSKRVVAHKKLLLNWRNDETEKKRFLREARVTAMLQHPNSVQLYDMGLDRSGDFYFTMQYVRGASFRQEIDRWKDEGTSLLDQGIPRLAAACAALEHAHGRRVVHRDLKPGNVITDNSGNTFLIDWGLAKVWSKSGKPASDDQALCRQSVNHLTEIGASIGTPLYMSPEQCAGSADIDTPSDIYSVGTIIYELTTGVPMFHGTGTAHGIIEKIQESAAPDPRELNKDIPEPVLQAYFSSIKKNPNERLGISELRGLLNAA